MDQADRRILDAVQKDGRASYQELGEAVGLSLSACHKRVKSLEANGVIARYAAIVDERKAGFPLSAFVSVTLRDQKKTTLATFEKSVVARPEIMDCVLMSGDSDYLLRVICSDLDSFEYLHKEVLTALPGVERIKSAFAMRTVCRRTAVPVSMATKAFPGQVATDPRTRKSVKTKT
ncbi:MAG: Lrp/AsnC family transcriptional regulator [Pseudomonadota bacterium]